MFFTLLVAIADLGPRDTAAESRALQPSGQMQSSTQMDEEKGSVAPDVPHPSVDDMMTKTPAEFFAQTSKDLDRRAKALAIPVPSVDELVTEKLTEGMKITPLDFTPVNAETETRAAAEKNYQAELATADQARTNMLAKWGGVLIALLMLAFAATGFWVRRARKQS